MSYELFELFVTELLYKFLTFLILKKECHFSFHMITLFMFVRHVPIWGYVDRNKQSIHKMQLQ